MVPTFKELPSSWKGREQTNFNTGYKVLRMHMGGDT